MEIIPIKKTKKKQNDYGIMTVFVAIILIVLIVGVATAIKKVADWGAGHQIIKQNIVKQTLQFQLPYRIEEIEAPEPVKEIVVVGTPYEDLTSTEQKIVQMWGDYKTSMIAIAIFSCESGLDPEAISKTGDIGIAQINWATWKKAIYEKFGYTAIDMFNVDKNLEVAYWIWDRGNGVEGDGIGSWEAWSVYKSGLYVSCLE